MCPVLFFAVSNRAIVYRSVLTDESYLRYCSRKTFSSRGLRVRPKFAFVRFGSTKDMLAKLRRRYVSSV